MKMMKKSLAMLLAVLVLFMFSIPAMAANADLSNHSYVTYQIFAGSQAEGDARLAEVEWGSGINGAAFLQALKQSSAFAGAFANASSAKDVAAIVQSWGDDSANAKTFAKIAYSYKSAITGGITNLPAGYYLVVDVTSFGANDVNTVYNLALLQLTQKGNFEIRNKVSVPEVIKKVKDTNDTAGTTTDWQDSADHDIGDNVPFQLKATLASIADYDTYKVVFHDSLSSGLTYNRDAVVRIDGNAISASAYTIRYVGTDLTVTINNVKAYGARDNSVITVDYTAKLNENAVIGSAGNPNTVYLEYSNNPNESGAGNNYTGKTPVDKVIVFTYKVIVDKVDENEEPLTGATFELLKKGSNGNYNSLGVVDGANISKFEWVGIDDGDYMLREVSAPKGYNKVEDIEFTVSAEHDVLADDPKLTSLDGGNDFTGEVNPGTLSAIVINEAGVTLPETGGIGTTIFYVLGGILLLGATVLLIARKRMQGAE